jgi:cell wall-associated NlpC family hydrolase
VAGQAPLAAAHSGPAQASVGSTLGPLPQPVSNSVVKQELAASGLTANPNQATLAPDGLAIPPLDAPPAVQEVIQAGNEIAHLPYRYGGGHMSHEDTAHDCSGSISYVFEAAHPLSGSVVSGDLMNWGDPGPGKWITVFANASHTFSGSTPSPSPRRAIDGPGARPTSRT